MLSIHYLLSRFAPLSVAFAMSVAAAGPKPSLGDRFHDIVVPGFIATSMASDALRNIKRVDADDFRNRGGLDFGALLTEIDTQIPPAERSRMCALLEKDPTYSKGRMEAESGRDGWAVATIAGFVVWWPIGVGCLAVTAWAHHYMETAPDGWVVIVIDSGMTPPKNLLYVSNLTGAEALQLGSLQSQQAVSCDN
ncbi:MAG: DUF2852 domain-containing protein [Pseudomonadota bacterium]